MGRKPRSIDLPNRIQALRLALGMTLKDVAEAVGTETATISKLELGRRKLTAQWMERIAPALNAAPADLLLSSVQPPESGGEIDHRTNLATSTVEPADIEIPSPSTFPRDMPVMGTAGGAIIRRVEGFRMQHEVVDYVRRPPILHRQMGAYAIFVTGESMVPLHNPGDLRFVDPAQRPQIGDSVVVQTKHHDDDPGQAYIKILKRRTPSYIVLQQLNPPANIEIPARFIVSIHRVLTMNDLFGV